MGQNPCGLTYAQRLRSQTVDPSWMPAKREVGNLKNYWDDDQIKPMFGGLDRKEREQKLMEVTKGRGVLDADKLGPKDFDELAPVVEG